jgi:hypothetical protein
MTDKESAIYATGYWNGIQKAKEKNATLDTRSYLIGRYDKLRELTDEEIMVLYEEYIETQYASESNVLGFGRAILRKAQEK